MSLIDANRRLSMRRFLIFAVAAVTALTLAGVAWGAAQFNNGHPPSCTPTTTSSSVTCTAFITGASSSSTPVYVVLVAAAGCSNSGNPDIQGQRAFSAGPVFSDGSGNINFSHTYTGTCPGNQTAFIGTPRTLQIYECSPGQAPRFQVDKKTGQITQTNSNCTLTDSASV